MELLQRNQLVWLQSGAWQGIMAAAWDRQAFSILEHWSRADLPLVVARQRADVAQDRICVGLPAPAKWERRRLALDVGSADVSRTGLFPLLSGLMPIASTLPAALRGLPVRVYGSHGWQLLTGMEYVHAASDADVWLPAKNVLHAIELAAALKAWNAPCRVDGEVVFSSGHAVAWRELLQAHEGTVSKVLVKHRQSAALMNMQQLESLATVGAEQPRDRSAKTRHLARTPMHPFARLSAHHAVRALYAEVTLEPKPGLVSLRDNGSHTDMSGGTFVRSLFALRHYFPAITLAGMDGLPFPALQALGIAAEARMLESTGGINTHRGAVFSLGLLCAAAGYLQRAGEPMEPHLLQECLGRQWGDALRAQAIAASGRAPTSHGQQAARAYGLRSAVDEAADGFPTLFNTTLPALHSAVAAGHGQRAARVQALFATMAVLDDTNVAHRAGRAGLHWLKVSAAEFLERGGVAQPDWLQQARDLHLRCVKQRLSPGGAADVLACACWVHSMRQAMVSQAQLQSPLELA